MSWTLAQVMGFIIALIVGIFILAIYFNFFSASQTQVSQEITTGVHTVCDLNIKGETPADVDKDSLPDSCDYCLGGEDIDVNNNLIADACEPKDFTGDIKKIVLACNLAAECKSGKCWSTVRNTCELDCYKTGECNI